MNTAWQGFERGIGIGGWLTNYKRFHVLADDRKFPLTIGDYEHFESYITEADIAYMASLGMDHVRVGFDQIVLEDAEKPGQFRECTFKHLDNFIAWCHKYHLRPILNMHKAIGNYCDVPSPVNLLDDADLQERFINFWLECERRWHDDNTVVFELLNEVLNVEPALWNSLAARSAAAIRKQNPVRKIIIGSTCWNSAGTLAHLELFDDDNIIYTYHFYEPHTFTHQRGVLCAGPLYYNRVMYYPGDIERFRDAARVISGNPEWNPFPDDAPMDINRLEQMMQGAFKFREEHPDKILWLGEFGTIRHAPVTCRENYMHDVILLAKEHGIPYCVWNYLSTPNDGNRFSLVDDDTRKVLTPRLESIIKGNVSRETVAEV